MAGLADSLIASLACEDAGFSSFTRGLSSEERGALVAELAVRARRPDGSVAALLRPLLHSPALRLPAAREAMRLMRAEMLSGKAAVMCLSEVRVALLRHWECRSSSSVDAGQRPPPSQRLDELLLLCEDVLGALLPNGSADGGSSAASESHRSPAEAGWGDGCTAAVQLLPNLLLAADSVYAELSPRERIELVSRHTVGTGGADSGGESGEASGDDDGESADERDAGGVPSAVKTPSEKLPSELIVSRLLSCAWEARCVLPTLMALEDVPLTRAHLVAVRRRVHRLLTARDDTLTQLRPQVRPSLQATPSRSRPRSFRRPLVASLRAATPAPTAPACVRRSPVRSVRRVSLCAAPRHWEAPPWPRRWQPHACGTRWCAHRRQRRRAVRPDDHDAANGGDVHDV